MLPYFLNDVIRAYSVSADPVGAETVRTCEIKSCCIFSFLLLFAFFCSTNKMDILRKKVCSFILTFNYSSYLFDDLKNKFKRFSH